MDAVPAPIAQWFLRMKAVSRLCAAGIMKFMCRQLFPCPAQQAVFLCCQGNVAKWSKPIAQLRFSAADACHGHLIQPVMQQQKSAAFRNGGQLMPDCLPDFRQHGNVFTQLFGIQLRIAAAQQHAVDIPGQMPIMQRRKGYQLRAHALQHLQAVRIVKTECFIPCHGNAQTGAADRHLRQYCMDVRCGMCQRQQTGQIQSFPGMLCQPLHFLL